MMASQMYKPLKPTAMSGYLLIDGYLMDSALGPRKARKNTDGDAFFSAFRAFRGQKKKESTNHTKGTKMKGIFGELRVFLGQKRGLA